MNTVSVSALHELYDMIVDHRILPYVELFWQSVVDILVSRLDLGRFDKFPRGHPPD